MRKAATAVPAFVSGAYLLFAIVLGACGGETSTSTDDGGAASDAGAGGEAAASEGGSALDGSLGDGGASDAGTYRCSSGGGPSSGVPAEFANCTQPSDCALVKIGCYCGNQPVVGVSRAYVQAAAQCEDQHAASCALGCALGLDLQAQDGKVTTDILEISLKCAPPPDGGAPICQSYVP